MAKTIVKAFSVFTGYLWYLSLYCIIFPFLVLFLGTKMDIFVFGLFFKTDPFPPLLLLPTIAGIALFMFGIIVAIASVYYLHKKARFFPLDALNMKEFLPQALVKEGVYGYVRHPMLLGYFFMMIGLAFTLSSPMSVIWTIPLFFWAAYEYEVLIEERRLLSWFGEEYITYKNTVPFMFPFLKKNAFFKKK